MWDIQNWFFESLLQPLMFWLGMANYLEEGYDAVGWFLWGCLEILLIITIIVPLERWRPVEPIRDLATIRVDILYTVIHRLGLFRVGVFLTLTPILDSVFGAIRADSSSLFSFGTFHMDQIWVGVTDIPVVSLILYMVVLDFVNYWIHRLQHALQPWWLLHSLHHAQQQMTCWSDNRNHVLDDLIRDAFMICLAFIIGVSPSQFISIVVLTQLSESFQHANLKVSFGSLGDRLWISPRFHRLHHSVSQGFGHNFGVLFPWWDILFKTANFDDQYDPTGVPDQVLHAQHPSTDYGRGFWSQQWFGFKRLGSFFLLYFSSNKGKHLIKMRAFRD